MHATIKQSIREEDQHVDDPEEFPDSPNSILPFVGTLFHDHQPEDLSLIFTDEVLNHSEDNNTAQEIQDQHVVDLEENPTIHHSSSCPSFHDHELEDWLTLFIEEVLDYSDDNTAQETKDQHVDDLNTAQETEDQHVEDLEENSNSLDDIFDSILSGFNNHPPEKWSQLSIDQAQYYSESKDNTRQEETENQHVYDLKENPNSPTSILSSPSYLTFLDHQTEDSLSLFIDEALNRSENNIAQEAEYQYVDDLEENPYIFFDNPVEYHYYRSPTPPYLPLDDEMVKEAIRELNEEGGSSLESISRFIESKYETPPCHCLRRLIETGEILVMSDGRYGLP